MVDVPALNMVLAPEGHELEADPEGRGAATAAAAALTSKNGWTLPSRTESEAGARPRRAAGRRPAPARAC